MAFSQGVMREFTLSILISWLSHWYCWVSITGLHYSRIIENYCHCFSSVLLLHGFVKLFSSGTLGMQIITLFFYYNFVAGMLTIKMINNVAETSKTPLYRNPKFILCAGFIVYYFGEIVPGIFLLSFFKASIFFKMQLVYISDVAVTLMYLFFTYALRLIAEEPRDLRFVVRAPILLREDWVYTLTISTKFFLGLWRTLKSIPLNITSWLWLLIKPNREIREELDSLVSSSATTTTTGRTTARLRESYN